MLLAILMLAACEVNTMKLTSPDFENNGVIPTKFTCDGEDAVPTLQWDDVPEGTKSFALTVLDPDAPMGTWIHWLVADISADVREVKGASPAGSLQVENDFKRLDWGGPCPPDKEHRYYFTVYALDVEHLELTKENFVDEVKKHALASAELMARYNRPGNQ